MAKTETTVRGYVYTVTSPNGGTVTDADGKLNKTVDAGDQVTVTAPSDALTCDDDDAVICKANFKGALAALALLGGGDKLPAGYTRLEFLECTGTQYIDTLQNAYNLSWELKFQVAPPGALDAYVYNGIFYDKKTVQVGCINDPDGRPFLNVRAYGVEVASYADKSARENPIHAKVNMSEASAFLNEKKIPLGKNRPDLYANFLLFARFNVGTGSVNYSGAEKIFCFNYSGKNGGGKLLPALDSTGTPCMFDLVSKQPFRNAGSGQFIAGVKNTAQLRTVLRKLPDRTGQDMGTLTLSIPAEANTPEMQELLDSTEAQKNWELTIQQRAAEASTYSLRRVRKVVWVRRVQDQNGSYVDADGSRCQTEWCSAIYSPLGNDPTLHGYEPFDSVEQAVEAWGLQPYEYPEAMGDNGTLEQGDTENTSPGTKP